MRLFVYVFIRLFERHEVGYENNTIASICNESVILTVTLHIILQLETLIYNRIQNKANRFFIEIHFERRQENWRCVRMVCCH